MNLKKIMVVLCSPHSDASLEEVDDSIIAHNIRTFPIMLVKRVKLTAKTVDEDPASCKRCISREEI